MKALQMTCKSEFVHAMKHPVKGMATLKGGIGSKTLNEHQIRKLREEMIREKRARKEQREWEAFLGKTTFRTPVRR